MKPLDPPDLKQCQAEKPNGCTFISLGGVPGLVRCTEKPFFIATENKPSEDGQIGSMSLCPECSIVLQKQLGDDFATMEKIEK